MEEKIIIKTSLSEKDTKDIYELAKSVHMKTIETLCQYIDGLSILDLKNKDEPVIVRIDKKVPYEKVVKVLDLLQKYSLNNLALVTNEEKK